MDITTGIAIYGALLSTIAVGWNIYNECTKRGKIKVRCNISVIINPGNLPNNHNVLAFDLTNTGKEPIIINKIFAKSKMSQKKYLFLFGFEPQDPPKKLEPSENTTLYMKNIASQKNFREITELFVLDTLGKKYKAPKKDIKEINQHITELLSSNK